MIKKDDDLTCEIGACYLKYLRKCLSQLHDQEKELTELCNKIKIANAIHLYGFGRSGAAAMSLAIRLRHFCNYLNPVWWVGDQVRMPIRSGDLVILFSQSGDREEVVLVSKKAEKAGAEIAVVTNSKDSIIYSMATIIIHLPKLDEEFVYGGGDFELAAVYFQEILVTVIGLRQEIPQDEVYKNHV
jgi:DNA-binding MurR/RpiR family transcriptional regulator